MFLFTYFLAANNVGKSTDSVITNVKVNVVKRQESNLTRRSLTKLREAIKQDRKPSKDDCEEDHRNSNNSDEPSVIGLHTEQQLSHSTILLADVSITFLLLKAV